MEPKRDFMIKIDYWTDYICPFCYIGETRLWKAIQELGLENQVEIRIRAFELEPSAPQEAEGTVSELMAQKYYISVEEAKKRIDRITQVGHDEGLDMRYATARITSTRSAHRLIKLAQRHQDTELVHRLSRLLFQAFFTQNQQLSHADVLLGAALQAGLDEAEVKALLASNQFEDEVLADEREMYRQGIAGVPYFDINDWSIIRGAQPLEAFKHHLMRAFRR